jgi:hypothetical protein
MAITFDNSTSRTIDYGSSPRTWSYTVGSDTNRLLLVNLGVIVTDTKLLGGYN